MTATGPKGSLMPAGMVSWKHSFAGLRQPHQLDYMPAQSTNQADSLLCQRFFNLRHQLFVVRRGKA